MSKTKILHVIKSLGRGGAEMLLPETLRVHDLSEFEFHVIYFLPWKNQMVSAIEKNGGFVTCFAARNNIQLLFRAGDVAKYCKSNNIEVIHAHLPWAGVLARIVGKMTRIPVIYTEHNIQERYHPITRVLNLFTINSTQQIVAVSNDVERSILRNKPKLKAPIKTILNGVDTRKYAPDFGFKNVVRKQLNIPANVPVVGTIAVFRFQKRLEIWLGLASQILKTIPNVHFILVGDGPLKLKLKEKVDELRIGANVHFAGLQEEIRPYLSEFDIFMVTSSFEGLPIALLEAMSSACPVITTDAGGIKEVLAHERDGLMCAVDTPELLIGYAIDLLRNADKRKMLGLNGRRRIEQAFSLEVMVKQLEALYASVRDNA